MVDVIQNTEQMSVNGNNTELSDPAVLTTTHACTSTGSTEQSIPSIPIPASEPTQSSSCTTEKDTSPPLPPQTQRSFLQCTYRTSLFAVPDIFYRGAMLWPKGIGLDSCFVGVMFLKSVVNAIGIIDPFAGQGTVLAMAAAVGLPSIGVELSAKRCRKAQNLVIQLDLISAYLRKLDLDVVAERAKAAAEHVPRIKTAEVKDVAI